MALSEGQVQVRDLVMGPGTDFETLRGFNPWAMAARVDQSSSRSQDHGSWSGSEWRDELVVPIPLRVKNRADRSPGGWVSAHQALMAAFAPSHVDIELRWCTGGVEYVMFGRPRVVEPEVDTAPAGWTVTRCAFAAIDPRIYSGTEVVASVGLPSSSGGLTWPVTWPVTWNAVVSSGVVQVYNAGKVAVRPRLVIYGPVPNPRVSLIGGGTLAWNLTLATGQWLDVDVDRRTSLINGQVSRSGQMTSREWFELPRGRSEIAFNANAFNPDASLTVAYRSAW